MNFKISGKKGHKLGRSKGEEYAGLEFFQLVDKMMICLESIFLLPTSKTPFLLIIVRIIKEQVHLVMEPLKTALLYRAIFDHLHTVTSVSKAGIFERVFSANSMLFGCDRLKGLAGQYFFDLFNLESRYQRSELGRTRFEGFDEVSFNEPYDLRKGDSVFYIEVLGLSYELNGERISWGAYV